LTRKAVIPAAGLGTRLLPVTKEQPKEMLSIFARTLNGNCCLKPVLQLVYEQLYDIGFREFCFIIGRGKRAIEDHFTSDKGYTSMLRQKGKESSAEGLENFYRRIEESTLVWINQPEPMGFGDAVLRAKSFIGNDSFIVHAGDTYVISDNADHLQRLMKGRESLDADAMLLVKEMQDPKQHGVIEAEEIGDETYKVNRAVEKPEKPLSKLAIMPIYVFSPAILKALERTGPGVGGEIQLTDAIQMLIESGSKVYARKLKSEEVRLDIGTPETYWEALKLSREYAKMGGVFNRGNPTI